ncbi:hypothetical protein AB4305_26875 [Nocardia sp. 2YAB30]|uniref:hypothetical protein n=1 Tax=Nocardia sp. 2YAB30 TaxID=3233022 RepID=UPI003F957AEB
MSMIPSRCMRHLALIGGAAIALIAAAAGPAAAEQQTVQLGFTNGNCSKTVIQAKARTRVILDVVTAGNPTTGAALAIPDKDVQLPLPDTFYWTVTRVDLGVNQPGPLPFQVVSPPWSGSAGSGCQGVIQFD